MTTFHQAVISPPGAGAEALALGRHMIRITAEQTGGALGCFESEIPPGEGPPFHIHEKEDEFFHILEGRFAFWSSGRRVELTEGGMIIVPRGTIHRFQNVGQSTGRMMVVVTPGGFEGFFPAVANEPDPTPERVAQIAPRFNLQIVPMAEAA